MYNSARSSWQRRHYRRCFGLDPAARPEGPRRRWGSWGGEARPWLSELDHCVTKQSGQQFGSGRVTDQFVTPVFLTRFLSFDRWQHLPQNCLRQILQHLFDKTVNVKNATVAHNHRLQERARFSGQEISRAAASELFGSRPSDHYFRSVCLSVCLFVCLLVCAEFFSAVFDPISIKLGHTLYFWV